MRRVLAAIAPCLLGACFMARQDARIRPGGQIGITSVVMHTPDALTWNPDSSLRGIPEETDASNVRGLTELTIAYGGKRVELRWHVPFLRWTTTEDFVGDTSKFSVPNPLAGGFELYLLLVKDGPVSAGIGIETARGGHAVITGELDPDNAVSLTVRACYGGKERQDYSGLFQAQVSYTHTLDADHDLRFFVSAVTFTGDKEPIAIRIQGEGYLDAGGRSYVIADTFSLIGASIDWH
jgi:hypothetical protein